MPVRSLTDVTKVVQQMQRRQRRDKPARALIHAIDERRVDIRVPGSPGVMRHVEVVGSVNDLKIGQSVAIQWEHGRPVVMLGLTRSSEVSGFKKDLPVDDDTLEFGPLGLRVKVAGLDIGHLKYDPNLQDKTEIDFPL